MHSLIFLSKAGFATTYRLFPTNKLLQEDAASWMLHWLLSQCGQRMTLVMIQATSPATVLHENLIKTNCQSTSDCVRKWLGSLLGQIKTIGVTWSIRTFFANAFQQKRRKKARERSNWYERMRAILGTNYARIDSFSIPIKNDQSPQWSLWPGIGKRRAKASTSVLNCVIRAEIAASSSKKAR